MRILKAIKKERKQIKYFFVFMIMLFIILPILAYLSEIKLVFLWSYLGILEILIIIACINKLNYHNLKYSCSNNKLKLKSGLFSKECIILCDKVSIVHTNKEKEEIDIILITTTRFRNKYLKPISKGFLKRYPEALDKYIKAKKINPEEKYYFQIIKRGSLKKYMLLDVIFRNCVRASYTSSAIENIKIAREQIEL